MRVIGVIPARYRSTRLEGKALADIHGKPMLQHVWERARKATCLDSLVVATDDQRIFDVVKSFGGRAVMTDPDHRSGTDRVAEAMADETAEVVVNIQGDEPMLDPIMISEIVAPFREIPGTQMVTLKKELSLVSEFDNPNVVKVVADLQGSALYFSRSLIPHPRRRPSHFRVFEHIGIYAYTRETLLRLSSLTPTPLEEVEGLEQLRALENGIRILVVETASRADGVSVDTPEDLERARGLLA